MSCPDKMAFAILRLDKRAEYVDFMLNILRVYLYSAA